MTATTKPTPRLALVLGLLFVAAAVGAGLRLLPYSLGDGSALTPWLWNCAPFLAMLIFGVASFRRTAWGLATPFAILLGTDYLLHVTGMAPTFLADRANVYIAYLVLGLLGLVLKDTRSLPRFAAVAVAGPVGFWLLTNFVHWLGAEPALLPPNGYPKTLAGLLECYALALPFLRNDLIGTAFALGGLFGGYALLAKALPVPSSAEPALAPVTTSA